MKFSVNYVLSLSLAARISLSYGQQSEAPSDVPSSAPMLTAVMEPSAVPTITGGLPTVAELVSEGSKFLALQQALKVSGLIDTLNGDGPFTLFAPNNNAFSALQNSDPEYVEKLISGPGFAFHKQNLLLYHVYSGLASSSDLIPSKDLNMTNMESLSAEGGNSSVLLGSQYLEQMATVVLPDVKASNGLLHEIDGVLLPSFYFNDLVDVASNIPGLSTFVSRVVKADLEDTLRSGYYTILAPTNEAFGKLPSGTLDELSDEDLVSILTYHVIEGVVPSTLLPGEPIETVQGQPVVPSVEGETIMFNSVATVTERDILAKNGIIYEIDTVLIPPEPTPTISPQQAMPTQAPVVQTTSPTTSPVVPDSSSATSYLSSVAGIVMVLVMVL